MQTKTLTFVIFSLFFLGWAGHITPVSAAQHKSEQPAEAEATQQKDQGTEDMCQQMMNKHQAMRQEMMQMDTRLMDLAEQMQKAKGEQKIEAMEAVIVGLVEQRQYMHQKMTKMQPQMMKHMMHHMKSGKTQCPMMDKMGKGQEHGQMQHGQMKGTP